MVLLCHHSALVLFDLGSTYSYVLAYFSMDLCIMCEPLAKPICVFTLVGESLMVNWVYWGFIVTLLERDSIANLILLDMVDSDV